MKKLAVSLLAMSWLAMGCGADEDVSTSGEALINMQCMDDCFAKWRGNFSFDVSACIASCSSSSSDMPAGGNNGGGTSISRCTCNGTTYECTSGSCHCSNGSGYCGDAPSGGGSNFTPPTPPTPPADNGNNGGGTSISRCSCNGTTYECTSGSCYCSNGSGYCGNAPSGGGSNFTPPTPPTPPADNGNNGGGTSVSRCSCNGTEYVCNSGGCFCSNGEGYCK